MRINGSSGVGIGSGDASSGVGESSEAVILGMGPERQNEAALAETDECAEEQRLARVAREILDTAPTDAQLRACDVFLDRGTYTTTALRAIERWLRDLDDAAGADLLAAFVARFAIHEAETI